MKKLFAIFAAALLVAAPAQAKIFGFGVAAGMNVTKADGDGWKTDAGSGWYAGVKAKVTIPVLGFGVDGAALFSQEVIAVEDASDRVGFLAVPINLRYDFSLPVVGSVVTPYLAVGPQFNYALKDLDFQFDYTNPSTGVDEAVDAFDTKKASWKLNLGLGAVLVNHLEVSYTYGLPLGKTFKENFSEYFGTLGGNTGNLKTGTHRIGVAWYF